MSEQLDDELKKRISKVFDQYEEDALAADEGWLMLREKFPEKANRRLLGAWYWRGMAAAVILALCLVGLWLQKQSRPDNQLTQTKPKAPRTSPATQQPAPSQPINPAQQVPAAQQPVTTEPSASVPASSAPLYAHLPSSAQQNLNPQKNQQPSNIRADQSDNPETYLAKVLTPALVNNDRATATTTGQQITGQADSMSNASTRLLAQQQANAAINKTDSGMAEAKKPSMSTLFAREAKELSKKDKSDSKRAMDKKVIYSIYAATYMNYAEGSSTVPNIGAGFTSDIRITSNIKLSTGIAIAQNKLSYNREPALPGILSDAVRASRGGGDQLSVADAPATMFSGLVSRTVSPAGAVKSYNVSLTGLDVPINIKYEFNPRKTDTYIAAGLSSGTFINETYRYQYSSTNTALGTTEALPDAQTSTSFTRFDFARTLNVALGMGVQLGKSNRLVIEPFLKYPLSGLGSQQIKFGAGGVNLKLNFQKARK